MPLYDYECKLCKKEESLIVRISESDTLPEIPADSPCKHEWVKVLKGTPTLFRGASWGPGKGYW